MYNTARKHIWFGELRTSRGDTVVIHDNQLPEASSGRIYLYNTDRNAIVEYVEDIVKPNLYALDEDAIKVAESKFGAAWKAARADFLSKRLNVNELESSTSAPKKSKSEVETEENFDSDYDNDWSDDDYDDE